MQSNSQGYRNHIKSKETAVKEEPVVQSKDITCRGLRAQANLIDEAAPAEVMKNFASGVVTECVRLNIRKTPFCDGDVVATIECLTDVVVDLKNSTDGFYKISTTTGVDGFCMKQYIAFRR